MISEITKQDLSGFFSNVCFQELSIHLRGHQRNLTQQEILKEWVKVEVNSFFPRNGKFVWLSGNKMKPGKFVVCQGSNAVFKHSLKAEIVSPRVLLTIHNVHSEPKYYLSKGNLTCLLTVSKCLSVTYWSFRLEFSILERFMCIFFYFWYKSTKCSITNTVLLLATLLTIYCCTEKVSSLAMCGC